jgi:predicted dehydrogenase
MPENERLGVGFIGSGFITKFHIRSWVGVREADIRGIWSPTKEHREEAVAYVRSNRVGDARPYDSISEMVAAPEIDCIWICGPNHKRIENVEEIVHTVKTGKGELRAIACEKPLARTVGEAKEVIELVESVDLLHGYLENQVFEPALTRGKEIVWRRGASLAGRPYMARASEEHSGPHSPWFWRADLQGGGVVTDMMCHSVEVGRYLLTEPDAPRDSITPKKVSAQINNLKWIRPKYMKNLRERMGSEVDYSKHPAEDFGRVSVTYEDEDGFPLVAELSTSWNFVGAGLRLNTELLGPEYSLTVDSLNTGNQVFFSRKVVGEAGEDLVEKQNAEQGLMPYMSNESVEYGYTAQNRYFARQFREGNQPEENLYAGLHVVEILMTAYMSAEQERTIEWRPEGLDEFVPSVAKGTWQPQ